MIVPNLEITAWNTGRGYVSEGQRIAAIVLPDKRVYFVDTAREIEGITLDKFNVEDWELRDFVMYSYDNNTYSGGRNDIFYDFD